MNTEQAKSAQGGGNTMRKPKPSAHLTAKDKARIVEMFSFTGEDRFTNQDSATAYGLSRHWVAQNRKVFDGGELPKGLQ